jgi:hypothetical protein
MIRGRKTRLAGILAVLLAVLGAAAPSWAQDSETKPLRIFEVAPKGGLDDNDRNIAGDFLAARGGTFPAAPRDLAIQVRSLGRWTPACAEHAQPVPNKLKVRLSPVPDGTFRVIFDRALVVIDEDTGQVIDRVEAKR